MYCLERKKGATCIKVWGPIKQQADISRPLPTPIDQVIEPENAILLQFLYDGTWAERTTSVQIRCLAKEARKFFTPSVTSLSLRYALLVYAGIRAGKGYMSPLELRNASLARRSLLKKTYATLDEGDLLASAVLAVATHAMTWFENKVIYRDERRAHIKGFLSILLHLSNDMEAQSLSGLENLKWLVRDLILWHSWDMGAPEFFHYYWFSRRVVGDITREERNSMLGLPDNFLSGNFLMSIRDVLAKAVEARLMAYDDSIDEPWVDIAVQDAREAIGCISISFLGWIKTKADAKWYAEHIDFRLRVCHILLAMLDTSDFVGLSQNPGVIEAAVRLSETLCDVLQYQCPLSEDDRWFEWLGGEVGQSLILLLLAMAPGVDLRSMQFANCEFHFSINLISYRPG